MRKLTTKLFISMIAVAFAFVALGTSTFAWFSMNTRVDVTGMEIGARSNNTFLLIGDTYDTNDATTIENIQEAQENTTITFSLTEAEATVLPAKPLDSNDIGEGKLFATGTPVTSYATAAEPTNWYTAANNNPKQSTDSIKSQHLLGPDSSSAQGYDADYAFSKYVIKKTVYLTLAKGANNATNLKVTATVALKTGQAEEKTNINGVKVLVITDADNKATFAGATNSSQNLYTNENNVTLTDSTLIKADIYIYYDGSVADVKTENRAILAAATVNLAFGVDVVNG